VSGADFTYLLVGFVYYALNYIEEENIFTRPAPDHRFLQWLQADAPPLEYPCPIRISWEPMAISGDNFPSYVYDSSLSYIFASEQWAVKASPFGRGKLFIDRELEVYRRMVKMNDEAVQAGIQRPFEAILYYAGCFRTERSTFICMERATPILHYVASQREALARQSPFSPEGSTHQEASTTDAVILSFPNLVTLLKNMHTLLGLVHSDVRLHNIMTTTKGAVVLIDFAFAERVDYCDVQNILDLVKRSLYFDRFIEQVMQSMPEWTSYSGARSTLELLYQSHCRDHSTVKELELEDFQRSFDRLNRMLDSMANKRDALSDLKTFFLYIQDIISYGKGDYVSVYRGSYSTTSDNILRALVNRIKAPTVSINDDLESLVKSFILLFEPTLAAMIDDTSYKNNLDIWTEMAQPTISTAYSDLFAESRRFPPNYTKLCTLMKQYMTNNNIYNPREVFPTTEAYELLTPES